MGSETPKQFRTLGGIPLVIYTLRVFNDSKAIDQIILVVPKEELESSKVLVSDYRIEKVEQIVAGGSTRQDSVYAGAQATTPEADFVMIHDGVRPLVTETVIRGTLDRAREIGAAIAAVPVSDTLKESGQHGRIKRTWDREGFWLAQTPQVFRREMLLSVLEQAQKKNLFGTDEASLVEQFGFSVALVQGSRENIKITTPDDLAVAEYFLSRRGERGAS